MAENKDNSLIWMRVKRFPTNWVSSNGFVLSLHPRYSEGRVLKFGDRKGYNCVTLVHNRIKKTINVHQLMALTFLKKPDGEYYEVNHKDCNKHNNDISNLEWVTKSENIKHAWANGKIKGRW